VEQNKERPFFLYLAHFAVHDPIQGRGDLVVRYENELGRTARPKGMPYLLEPNPDSSNALSRETLNAALRNDDHYRGFSLLPNRTVKIKQRQDNPEFAAMVEAMDESFGRVLDKLKELRLDEKTIVIFFSDNGGMSGANFGNPKRTIRPATLNKAYSTSNLPLRGGKGWLYEGGIREPLIIYWPQQRTSGRVFDVPVISTDFYRTILSMIGAHSENAGKNGIDGMSLVPLLKNLRGETETLTKRPLYWHWPHYSNHGAQSPAGAVRLGDFKLIEYYENYTVQLFKLKTDPGEQHDLAKSDPRRVEELRAMLHKWRTSASVAMPAPNPNFDPAKAWPSREAVEEP
jgi:arylsulfatase A-like enzyme